MEPFKLRKWRVPSGAFFTCARPGRSHGKGLEVAEKEIHRWVKGLHLEKGSVIVSLLGKKQNGMSEYRYYPFRGGWDPVTSHPTFQKWLDLEYPALGLLVIEHPTIDYEDVPPATRIAIGKDVVTHLKQGKTVVLVDSGGEARTDQVARLHMNLTEG